MVEYCQEDVTICGELYHYLLRELKGFEETSIELEHQVQAVIAKQERHGFKLDPQNEIKDFKGYKIEKLN